MNPSNHFDDGRWVCLPGRTNDWIPTSWVETAIGMFGITLYEYCGAPHLWPRSGRTCVNGYEIIVRKIKPETGAADAPQGTPLPRTTPHIPQESAPPRPASPPHAGRPGTTPTTLFPDPSRPAGCTCPIHGYWPRDQVHTRPSEPATTTSARPSTMAPPTTTPTRNNYTSNAGPPESQSASPPAPDQRPARLPRRLRREPRVVWTASGIISGEAPRSATSPPTREELERADAGPYTIRDPAAVEHPANYHHPPSPPMSPRRPSASPRPQFSLPPRPPSPPRAPSPGPSTSSRPRPRPLRRQGAFYGEPNWEAMENCRSAGGSTEDSALMTGGQCAREAVLNSTRGIAPPTNMPTPTADATTGTEVEPPSNANPPVTDAVPQLDNAGDQIENHNPVLSEVANLGPEIDEIDDMDALSTIAVAESDDVALLHTIDEVVVMADVRRPPRAIAPARPRAHSEPSISADTPLSETETICTELRSRKKRKSFDGDHSPFANKKRRSDRDRSV